MNNSKQMKEYKFYSTIANWLNSVNECMYVDQRKIIWGKEFDVIGIKFDRYSTNDVKADFFMVEVKVINSIDDAYNLIGETEIRVASFLEKNSIFYSLYPYIAIFENAPCEEIRWYAKNRRVGLLKLVNSKEIAVSIIKSPKAFLSNKVIPLDLFNDTSRLKNPDESRILEKAIKTIGWQKLKNLLSYNLQI